MCHGDSDSVIVVLVVIVIVIVTVIVIFIFAVRVIVRVIVMVISSNYLDSHLSLVTSVIANDYRLTTNEWLMTND